MFQALLVSLDNEGPAYDILLPVFNTKHNGRQFFSEDEGCRDENDPLSLWPYET